MLEYDEWVVPGEVEYAEKKAAEIEAQIEKYHENYSVDKSGCYLGSIHIQLTEHIWSIFKVRMPNSLWSLPDIDVYNYMNVDWFRNQVAPIDEPKIFDLPANDIRNSLPGWEESLIPDDLRKEIIVQHSVRHMAADAIKYLDGDWRMIKREFNLSDGKCDRVMETLDKKLNSKNKSVIFTELEEKIADYIKGYHEWHFCPYEVEWYFPLAMMEEDIINAIQKAYLNASKRSRRRIPVRYDYAFIGCGERIENSECLYQGRTGDMSIRFLFDYKDMKIVMVYPVLKEKIWTLYDCNYYDKSCNRFFGE